MSAEKVVIDYDLLVSVRDSITKIIAELEDAPERSRDIPGAIGRPYQHSELRAVTTDFRGAWEPKRGELITTLEEISHYIDNVVDSYIGLDRWF